MSAFTDLLDLRTAVIEEVASDGVVEVFPRLVRLFESEANSRLRIGEQVSETTLTIVSGAADLPAGVLEAIGLYDGNGAEYIQRPPQDNRSVVYDGDYYWVDGDSIKTTGADGDRAFQYYTEIPSIADAMTDSNWLLQKHPALYLYGVAFEAAKWLKNVDLAAAFRSLREQEFTKARSRSRRERFSRARIRTGGACP